MRRVKMSRKQWEGIGKKAGWIKPLHKDRENSENDGKDCHDEMLWTENVKLDRIGDSLVLRDGDTAILSCKTEMLIHFLERAMIILREEKREAKEGRSNQC